MAKAKKVTKTKAKSKAKKTSTAVSKKGAFTQNDIPAALEQIKAQIAELGGGDDTPSTAAKVDFPNVGKISDINDVSELIKVHSIVMAKAAAYQDSVATLDLVIKVPAFKIADCTVAAWEKEIKQQITRVVHSKKIESLKKVQRILEERQTEEQKMADSMAEIGDLMNEANNF